MAKNWPFKSPGWKRLVYVLIALLVWFFISTKIDQKQIDQLLLLLSAQSSTKLFAVLSAFFFLAACNIFLDVKSWQAALPIHSKETIRQATRTHLEAMAWALISPANLGEYAGRAMRFAGKSVSDSLGATTIYKFSRLMARQGLGVFALGFLYLFGHAVPEGPWWIIPLLALLVAPSALYFLRTGRGIQKLPKKIKTLFPDPQVWKSIRFYNSLGWASAKFLSYSLQLTLLLQLVGDQAVFTIWPLVMAFYFVAAWVPVVGLLDGLVKSGLALVWFGSAGIDPTLAAATAFGLWLVNTGTQSLVGSLLLLSKLKS